MAKGDLTRGERLQIMLSPEEMQAVDDFRFKQRMPSRAAAVRVLMRLGMTSESVVTEALGRHSVDYRVLDPGPHSKKR